jgi:transposase
MHVDLKEPVKELRRLYRGEKSARQARRLRIIILAAEQHTAEDISRQVDLSPRQVQSWVRRYNREGLTGLDDRGGRGPKALLTSEEADRLRARLDAGPDPEDGVCTLRGKDVQRILAEEFGKLRKLGAVYKLLHHLGYASLVPRPEHRRTDPAAQEAFKKSSLSSYGKFSKPIRIARSKYSFRTKRGLANKGP